MDGKAFLLTLTEPEKQIYLNELAALQGISSAEQHARHAVENYRATRPHLESSPSPTVPRNPDEIWPRCIAWACSLTGLSPSQLEESRPTKVLAVVALAELVGRRQTGKFLNSRTYFVSNCYLSLGDREEQLIKDFVQTIRESECK